jgi:hypothetical protein
MNLLPTQVVLLLVAFPNLSFAIPNQELSGMGVADKKQINKFKKKNGRNFSSTTNGNGRGGPA